MNEFVVGVDEVGRGCLAGPVFAAAVIFKSDFGIPLFEDSKALSEKKREFLAEIIHKHHFVAVGSAGPREIEQFNILQASFLAMRRAIEKILLLLPSDSQIGIVVDGHLPIPQLSYPQEPIVQGDEFIPEISAASIVAKVTRDHLMKQFSREYPHYGFERHKGYGSKTHRAAIKKFGPTSIHRQTFSGVREWVGKRPAVGKANPEIF